MTAALNEDSRLAAEALRKLGHDDGNDTAPDGTDLGCRCPNLIFADRLETGELVVAPANRVAGEGQVVVDIADLEALFKDGAGNLIPPSGRTGQTTSQTNRFFALGRLYLCLRTALGEGAR